MVRTADPLASDVWIEDASIVSIIIQLQAEDMGLLLLSYSLPPRYAPQALNNEVDFRFIKRHAYDTHSMYIIHEPASYVT